MHMLSTEYSTLKKRFPSIECVTGPEAGWRLRAKLAVRGRAGSPKIGLFEPGTHEVIDKESYPEHHPSIDRALSLVRQSLQDFRIHPFDEKSLKGEIRYLQFVVERTTEKVQLTLVANGKAGAQALQPVIELLKEDPLFHSIWVNIQEGSTNTILGKEWILCFGEKWLWQTVLQRKIAFHPACFQQANLALFEKILEDIQQHVLPKTALLELYAGVGMMGWILSSKCSPITCVENNPYCKASFEETQKKYPNPSIHFLEADARTAPLAFDSYETLIVDPPRKGIDALLMEKILKTQSLQQLIYVSCNVETFLRDLGKIIKLGWEIEFIRCYALFPGTQHLETLTILQKKSG